jgi:hypothetical protein
MDSHEKDKYEGLIASLRDSFNNQKAIGSTNLEDKNKLLEACDCVLAKIEEEYNNEMNRIQKVPFPTQPLRVFVPSEQLKYLKEERRQMKKENPKKYKDLTELFKEIKELYYSERKAFDEQKEEEDS